MQRLLAPRKQGAASSTIAIPRPAFAVLLLLAAWGAVSLLQAALLPVVGVPADNVAGSTGANVVHASPSGGGRAEPLTFGNFAGGSEPYRTSATVDATTVVENPWVRVESHTVQLPALTAAGKPKTVKGWWWLQVADHINVLPQLSAATVRRMLSLSKSRLPQSLRDPRLSPSAQAEIDGLHQQQHDSDDREGGPQPLFILYRQPKYGITGSRDTIAVLGGLKNDTEDAVDGLLSTARRELAEELGLRARRLVKFGEHRVDGNRGCGYIGTFLALDSEPDPAYRPPTNGDNGDLERQAALIVSLDDLLGALERQEVRELKWSHTIAMAVLHFRLGLRCADDAQHRDGCVVGKRHDGRGLMDL